MENQDLSEAKDSLLVDQEVQSIVQKMVDQGAYLITPQVDAKGLSYPAVAEIFSNKSESEVEDFLQKLAAAGILRSKLLDKIIMCPTCGSASVYSKYNCPRCSSFDIGKASIIEHIRCGYIGSKEKFQKGKLLVCPKCKNIVSETDYRKIGTSFECNSCGSRFESPKMSHKCNSCDDVFTYKEARYEPIYEFELSEETKKTVAKGTLPLASIVGTLKEADFDVGLKRDIVGKSGAVHNFDIVAKKDSVLVVANFTFEPKEEDIIGLFAKKYDVDPTFTLLIALTPPSKEEEAVSKAYGVMILSSSGTQSIGDQIIALVDSYILQEKSKSGSETNSPVEKHEEAEPSRSVTPQHEVETGLAITSQQVPVQEPPILRQPEITAKEEISQYQVHNNYNEEPELEEKEEKNVHASTPEDQIHNEESDSRNGKKVKKSQRSTSREFTFSEEDWEDSEF